MRGRYSSSHRRAHGRPLLAARGRSLRIFGGQAVFLALAFLMLGAYFLEQQFADPVRAQASGLLVAAVLIAAAVTLLYCLLRPVRRLRHHRIIIHPTLLSSSSWSDRGLAATERQTSAWRDDRKDPLPHRYVDRTRIRP
jgi:uncharacterized BrkB/YihY/UPF0761 family membrane protein